MMKRYENQLLFIAVLAAPVFILCAIFIYGVPVPYYDQWELVPLIQKLNNHSLRIADLWGQHNEHRIFLPRAIMLFLAKITGWNIYYEFLASYLVALTTFILLWSMLKKTFDGRPPAWLSIAFSLVIFSPIQFENWLWGWQLQFFMAILGAVAAVWSLHRRPDNIKGLVIAIAAAVFSTFSLSCGLFLWIAILPMFIFSRSRNWKHILLWCIAAAGTFTLYLHGYAKPVGHPSLYSFMHDPIQFIKYIFLYLGSPLGFGKLDAALTMGILILMVAAIILAIMASPGSGSFEFLRPWIALGLQAVVSAAATGVGRVGFGARQALSSRYSTIASLLLLAVFVIVASWLAVEQSKKSERESIRQKAIATTLLAIFAVTYAKSFACGLHAMKDRSKQLQACRIELMAFPNSSREALGILYPVDRIKITYERIQALRSMGIIMPPGPAAK
jgi:hypothetical protein